MITTLLIILAVLLIGLWISAMALWWQAAHEVVPQPVDRRDFIQQWNKAARLSRRSWYNTMRYSKQAALWGNEKVSAAFVIIFPKSKAAFVKQDPLIGLEHGPSSYFLASISKSAAAKAPMKRRKKAVEEAPVDLSEE